MLFILLNYTKPISTQHNERLTEKKEKNKQKQLKKLIILIELQIVRVHTVSSIKIITDLIPQTHTEFLRIIYVYISHFNERRKKILTHLF